MLCKLVGSGMKEKLWMFGFIDSPWREYRSRESPAGEVVEVLGIRVLHLACSVVSDAWHSCLGQGEVGTIVCEGKRKNPLDSSFGVIME